MDINKIKERLAALRAEDLDPEDPEIGELLMLVEEDLELAEWFAQEQVFDQAFAEKLQEITPPADLDERIIAAMEKTQSGDTPPVPAATGNQPTESQPIKVPVAKEPVPEEDDSKVTEFSTDVPTQPISTVEADKEPEEPANCTAVPFNPASTKRPWWQNPSLISAAAAVILLLVVGVTMFNGPELQASEDLNQFYEDISKHHSSHPDLSLESADLSEINNYLEQQGAPTAKRLPPNIDMLPEVGCSVMQWGGRVVSVIRMNEDESVDVYIVHSDLFPDFSSKPQPQTVTLDQIVVLGWSDGDLLYFLVRSGDIHEIESLL
ncbi:hypothetical protein [Cerasicoccus fimbriatus]|uniref:hypothetical protein n=1 Tax=Cerasicoccus fimbriatus TaxID=3014554 RepID=UPI0022B58890|nr:hypothetical protein [Cerasicoccus sp. TK19100]